MIDKKTLQQTIIEGIQEKKGRDISVVDLSHIETAATSCFIIGTGNAPMQVEAVADSVREYVEKHTGVRPLNYDGYDNAEWIIIDYGDIYVHIFLPDVRERYNLEQLWNDATITNIPNLD